MEAQATYQERLARVKKAMACEPVDRAPVVFMGQGFAPRVMGMKMSDYCKDNEAAWQVKMDAMDRFPGFDAIMNVGGVGGVYLAPWWLSHVNIPGRELPEDSLWQVQEAELMTQDDYEAIVAQGWPVWQKAFIPRIADPAELASIAAWNGANRARMFRECAEHGYAVVCSAVAPTLVPFEPLCGGRSFQQFIFDLHRIPDRVEAAMQAILEVELAGIKAAPEPNEGGSGVWVGGWRTASAMLSPRLWNRFVWPYIVQIVDALVARGITPVLHWDQDWTRDLVRLQELPAKKCVLNPDGMTDVRKFRELLRDNMSMMGDVPASLLVAGTPDEVYNYVADLVRDIGVTGLLLCPGCDAPINTKPENMAAFVAASLESGKAA